MEKKNQNQETGLRVADTETGVAKVGGQQTVIGTNAVKLAEILMENINKVKDDPKYIAQAESVNSQVKSMIELGKSEIEMLKLQAFMSSR
jgi:hypothetical protein